MTTIYVQFSGKDEKDIVTYFSNPPLPDSFENLGTVDESDPRYAAFWSSFPVIVTQYWPVPTKA
ncbi:hypothetical protein WP5S18C02_03190 [Enterobacter cloacae]|uniref:Uncharacterized protein n=1 Tax=Enterobacter cloacae TaxID=550 RepID=A0A6S5JGT8_ENTCL|nr:hypothetical protein WP5S18C02_03190 [Enterobacter cloacae]